MATSGNTAVRTDRLLESYWREIKDNEPLGREEEVALVRRAREGEEAALRRIVEANLRFVMRVANEYVRPEGPPLIELVSEGNLGLINAIQRFDESRGFKFITYAVWWIRQAIHRALAEQRRSTRQPMNRLDDFRALERRSEALSQRLGRLPTFQEVLEDADLSPGRALSAVEAHQQDVSFDEPLYPDSDLTLHSVYGHAAEPEDELEQDALRERLQAGLARLDPREAAIVRFYYGLGGVEPKTLEEIGGELDLTRERVRQLRNRALDKLRLVFTDSPLEPSMN